MTRAAALVWFKRDLRVRDQAPLAEALNFDSALGPMVIEPSGWSYTRDLAVAGWASQWAQRMNAPEAPLVAGFNAAPGQPPDRVPTLGDLGLPAVSAALPAAGERAAWATLESFLAGRGRDYRHAMSSPLSAAEGCEQATACTRARSTESACKPGVKAAPATRWSMPACTSCARPVG